MKKIILLIVIGILCFGSVYAATSVTRDFSNYNCPDETRTTAPHYKSLSSLTKVTLTLSSDTGFSSCSIVEKVPTTWTVHQASGSVSPMVTDSGGVRSIRLIGVTSSTVSYYLGVPDSEPNQRAMIGGDYSMSILPSGSSNGVVTSSVSSFYVRDHTCNSPGVMFSGRWWGEDDHDLDGSGKGCACPNDCDDNDWFRSPTHPEYWCNLPGGHVVDSSIGISQGNDDDCSAGPCCRVEQYNVNQAMHYDGWFNKQCGSLDNAEKKVFVNMWLKGVANPSPLSEITLAIPTDWTN